MATPNGPQFDFTKASFYLVAAVFAVYSVAILSSLFFCFWEVRTLLAEGWKSCGKEGIIEPLATLLASALAFAAGHAIPPKK